MRTKVTVVFLGLLLLVAVPAQSHMIGLYADPLGSNCNITEDYYLEYVYVPHHVSAGGATGCAFSAP